jgi:molybdopterin molybdotransferase
MAQLSDDCFAFGGPLLSVEAAAALIADRVPPLAGEAAVALRQALGRVLARPLIAPLPLPPFFNSAVDGYAFRHADLGPAGPTSLRLEGRVAAGQAAAALGPGVAARIFTGAPMPPGADTVVMQEDARLEAGAVLVPPGLKPGANARPAGEDVRQGTAALPAGRRLRAPEIGLAAALGLTTLPVAPLVRVGVFSTGDELASPGTPLGPAQTHDSNRFTLLALLARLPVAATDLGILPDDAAAADLGRREHRGGRPRPRRHRTGRAAGVLAPGGEAGAAGRHGRGRWHAGGRAAGQPGGRRRHLPPSGAAAGAAAGRGGARAIAALRRPRRIRPSQESRAAGIRPGAAGGRVAPAGRPEIRA